MTARASWAALIALLLVLVASADAQETGSSFGGGSFHDPPSPTTPRRGGGSTTGSEIHRSPAHVDEARLERERAWREEQSRLARERAGDPPPGTTRRTEIPWGIIVGLGICSLLVILPLLGIIAGLRRSNPKD